MTRQRWIRVARAAWLLLLAVLVARVLIQHRDQLADLLTVDHPWLLAAALATSFGQLALNAAFWVRALGALGEHVPWSLALGVTARSVPARYVPGSIWYAASRAGMLRTSGIRTRALAVTALLESVLTVIVSLAAGAALLALAGRMPGDRVTGVLWVVALGVVASPPVLNRALTWLARRRGELSGGDLMGEGERSEPAGGELMGEGERSEPAGGELMSWSDYRALVGWMVAFWLLSATTFTLYLSAFGMDLPGPLVVAGVFLVAWAVGFLTPIAPQGAGAFEVVFVTMLLGAASGPLGVVVGGYRALIGLRDAVAFAWGSWRGRLDARAVSAPDGAPR